MEKFVVIGGNSLKGETSVSGAKNVVLKAFVAAALTEDEVTIHNIPLISDLKIMVDIIKELGGSVELKDHSARIKIGNPKTHKISLERAVEIRTSAMFMSPLLLRLRKAIIPNPGGCRIGARPIDRTIDGLIKMGADIEYNSDDGYFYCEAKEGLKGVNYRFSKNTHTGTETLIMAAVLAKGETILENAAEEPEVDELIDILNSMGAKITKHGRTVKIKGVEKLHGTEVEINPDRNEIVTIACAAVLTKGDVFVKDAHKIELEEFLLKLEEAGGGYEKTNDGIRFYYKGPLSAVNVVTGIYPGFMTDWQGPWATLMTQASGDSIIHETVYEDRFGYARELIKMGAKIELFNPEVKNPEEVYNFNIQDDSMGHKHAEKISGPVNLHNAIVNITDLRAGATLVLASLIAKGETVIFGIEHLDRGYEKLDVRLSRLGANIKRLEE